LADEYKDGKVIGSELIFDDDNEYHYYETGKKEYFLDFIDQIKLFTKTEEQRIIIYADTDKFRTKKELAIKKTEEEQFFVWRRYRNSKWKLNEKIPLILYASSWKDPKHGFQRFCGAVILSPDDEKTKELLSNSPNYFLVSYLVSEIIEEK